MSVLEMNAAKFPAPVKALYVQVQAVAEWGKDGLVEIVVVSGFYQMFAAINQGFDIQPPGQPAAPLKA
jgi:hypothetical protein